jgi:hypothetical protein
MATASRDDTIKLWDLSDGRVKLLATNHTLKGHTADVWAVAFSPDGHRLASASADTTVKVWDIEHSGALSLNLEGHTGMLRAVVFCQNGELVASGGKDTTIRVWDAATGRLKKKIPEQSTNVYSLAATSDGRRLASGQGDGTVKIWDVETCELILSLKGHPSSVQALAFGNNDQVLVSGGYRTKVRVWHAPRGLPRQSGVLPQAVKINWHWQQARDSCDAQEWDAALWHLTRLADGVSADRPQQPTRSEVVRSRGAVYSLLQQHQNAVDDYTEAIRLTGKAADWHSLGHCYEKLGELDKSIDAFDECVKAAPNALEYWRCRGRVLRSADRWAASAFNRLAIVWIETRDAYAPYASAIAQLPLDPWNSVLLASHDGLTGRGPRKRAIEVLAKWLRRVDETRPKN